MKSLVFAAGIATVLIPSAASAAVVTMGGPLSKLCYESATSHEGRDSAIDGCTRSLQEEALGPDDLPDHDGGRDAREDQHAEDVREPAEPLLSSEPGQLDAPVDRRDHRHQDRGEEDEKAPEDEGVHQARDEPPQQLPLTEHDPELRLGLA